MKKYLFVSKNSGAAVITAEDDHKAYLKLEMLYPTWAWTYEYLGTVENITVIN